MNAPRTVRIVHGDRRRAAWGWRAAGVLALAYFLTSLVVVLNSIGNATGVVWLPSFPAWYYAAARALYWPFQPYFAVLRPLQASPDLSYTAYAAISRAPFLVVPLALLSLAAIRSRRGRARTRPGPGGLSAPHRTDHGDAETRRRQSGKLRALGGSVAWSGVFRGRALVVLALAIALALYAAVPPLRLTINAGITALDPRDIGRLRDYLRGFGPWAPAVSFLLMVLQSVAAPLPAFVITLANGLLFGAFWGTVLSWSSAMVGAAVCYGIAKSLGRPVVERLVGARPLARSDAFFSRHGSHAVLVARLIPIISFDVVSYAAGLTSIGLVPFLVATGLGQLPATVAYSVLGENLTSGSRVALWAIGVLASLMVVGVAVKRQLDRQPPRPAALAERQATPG